MMKRMILLAGMTVAMLTATAQDNPYIVKTKNVKKTAVKPKITATDVSSQDAEPKDFMGKNFRYYSMCDWKEGMRFMVVPITSCPAVRLTITVMASWVFRRWLIWAM